MIVDPPADTADATVTWVLKPSPKYARSGVVRVVPPEDTIRRVEPLMNTMGVTRLADVTGLDRVGIPNYVTVRPRERGDGISYYNGKGLTRAAARAGALMEAVERFSAEFCDLPVFFGTHQEMARRGTTVNPAEIIAPRASFQAGMQLEWIEGFDLLQGCPTYLPLNAVVCPYEPPAGQPMPYFAGSNGLASGNTKEEAICHALCEVIERDATALSSAALDLTRAVQRIFGLVGVHPVPMSTPRPPAVGALVDLKSLPPRALRLVQMMQRAGLTVYLRDVTSTAGIATLDCAIVEPQFDGRHLVHGGSGTHPDASVAATRALTEAAQSRVAHIQGGREDLPLIVTNPEPFDPDELFGQGDCVDFSAIPSYQHDTVDADIRFLLARMSRDRFDQVVAVDLTRPETGVPVVRIVVPRAETWSVYFTHVRRAMLGDEANRALCAAVHQNTDRAVL